MYANIDRPCRKNLTSQGMIYMGGEEQDITVTNISIIGVLAELNSKNKDIDVKSIFNILLTSTIVDMYLPDMRLAGEAEVVRVDVSEGRIFLALIFKNVYFDIDRLKNKRKSYRKHLSDTGIILLKGHYHDFTAVNVSAEGMMIRIAKPLYIDGGLKTLLEFKKLNLKGEVEKVWSENNVDVDVLIGLRFVNISAEAVKGIPRFATTNAVASA